MTKDQLEKLYQTFNARRWVHPDPLEFLYEYPDPRDREIVGIIASSLAYGRVAQILKSVSAVLEKMGPSPHGFLDSAKPASLKRSFADFRHRFTSGEEMIPFFRGIQKVLRRYGSLQACFICGYRENHETVLPALGFMVKALNAPFKGKCNSLLPDPEKGSACKRLNLFLRWMIRRDRVDPGGWDRVAPAKLIVPLDTHMHRTCLHMKFTLRKNATMRTAVEATHAFRKIAPLDPVRYDFALTRLGIRKDGPVAADCTMLGR